jgi:dihydrodipicolinate synthase/N-acetylneuraminate lyase
MPTEKISKTKAEYIPLATREQCRTCTMFQDPNGCISVLGNISPRGHCKLYAAAHGVKGRPR